MQPQPHVMQPPHTAELNDMVVDSLGSYCATCGDDRTINLYEIHPGPPRRLAHVTTLIGHEDAVLRVAWAPGRARHIASCGLDSRMIIWRAVEDRWEQVYTRRFPEPILSLQWCPDELGLAVAGACADGRVYVIDNTTGQGWSVNHFGAHLNVPLGCTGVSWAPHLPPGALVTMPLNRSQAAEAERHPTSSLHIPKTVPKLVTCGGEREVKVWYYNMVDRQWVAEKDLKDSPGASMSTVAWAPNVGVPIAYIAAGSDDGFVTIWLQDATEGAWRSIILPQFQAPISRVGWSLVGTFLNVTCADGSATLWKEAIDGEWSCVSTIAGSRFHGPIGSTPIPGSV